MADQDENMEITTGDDLGSDETGAMPPMVGGPVESGDEADVAAVDEDEDDEDEDEVAPEAV